MIKILLCCGGGFSSSYVAVRMQKEIEEKGLENQYSIEFYPLGVAGLKYAKEKLNQYDIAICCPHLKMDVKKMMVEREAFHMPIYLLPPKIYGNMHLEDIIMDCKDIIQMFREGHINPVSFPGEDNLLRIRRGVAYRKTQKNK